MKEKLRIWDVQAGKFKQTLEENGPIAFTPDLKTFASRSDDKTVVKLSHVE
jgi:WD40 repeat protein